MNYLSSEIVITNDPRKFIMNKGVHISPQQNYANKFNVFHNYSSASANTYLDYEKPLKQSANNDAATYSKSQDQQLDVSENNCPHCSLNYNLTLCKPLILPCKHSFCEQCLAKNLTLNKKKKLCCTICKKSHKIDISTSLNKIDNFNEICKNGKFNEYVDLPVNFSLVSCFKSDLSKDETNKQKPYQVVSIVPIMKEPKYTSSSFQLDLDNNQSNQKNIIEDDISRNVLSFNDCSEIAKINKAKVTSLNILTDNQSNLIACKPIIINFNEASRENEALLGNSKGTDTIPNNSKLNKNHTTSKTYDSNLSTLKDNSHSLETNKIQVVSSDLKENLTRTEIRKQNSNKFSPNIIKDIVEIDRNNKQEFIRNTNSNQNLYSPSNFTNKSNDLCKENVIQYHQGRLNFIKKENVTTMMNEVMIISNEVPFDTELVPNQRLHNNVSPLNLIQSEHMTQNNNNGEALYITPTLQKSNISTLNQRPCAFNPSYLEHDNNDRDYEFSQTEILDFENPLSGLERDNNQHGKTTFESKAEEILYNEKSNMNDVNQRKKPISPPSYDDILKEDNEKKLKKENKTIEQNSRVTEMHRDFDKLSNSEEKMLTIERSFGCYGEMSRRPGVFSSPTKLKVSDDGLITITDSKNQTVQVFTEDGLCLALIKVKNLTCALSYEINGCNRLIVGTNKEIKIFDFNGNKLASIELGHAVSLGLVNHSEDQINSNPSVSNQHDQCRGMIIVVQPKKILIVDIENLKLVASFDSVPRLKDSGLDIYKEIFFENLIDVTVSMKNDLVILDSGAVGNSGGIYIINLLQNDESATTAAAAKQSNKPINSENQTKKRINSLNYSTISSSLSSSSSTFSSILHSSRSTNFRIVLKSAIFPRHESCGPLNAPSSIAVDSRRRILVTDSANARVIIFNATVNFPKRGLEINSITGFNKKSLNLINKIVSKEKKILSNSAVENTYGIENGVWPSGIGIGLSGRLLILVRDTEFAEVEVIKY